MASAIQPFNWALQSRGGGDMKHVPSLQRYVELKIYCRRNPSDPWELDAIDLAIPTVAVALFLISGEFRKVL